MTGTIEQMRARRRELWRAIGVRVMAVDMARQSIAMLASEAALRRPKLSPDETDTFHERLGRIKAGIADAEQEMAGLQIECRLVGQTIDMAEEQ